LDHIEKTVEDINNKGTPANNTVAMVLESRLQSQSARIMAIEEAVKEFSGIRVNVEWIKDWIQRKQMKESL
jgi:hypothetical protein